MNFIKKIDLKRISQHLLFWLGFLCMHLITNNFENYGNYYHLAYIYFFEVVIQAIGSYGIIYFLIPKLMNKKKYLLFCIALIVWLYAVYALLICFKYYYLEVEFPEYFSTWEESQLNAYERLTCPVLFITKITWMFFPAAIFGLVRFYKNQRKLAVIEEEKKSMELKVLKNQLNPHFLFNTLNNLYTLALKKDDKTPEVIAKLSEMLDFVLYRSDEDFVDLEKEINLIENYISLEKLRYSENRLEVLFTKKINENYKITPLILLTFVENAFKHGTANETGKSKISMDLETIDNKINFKIKNTIPQNILSVQAGKPKIGLENIRKQLNILYPEKHILEIEETSEYFSINLTLSE